MATFILKKYQPPEENNNSSEIDSSNDATKESKTPEELQITITGSISEIVSKALYASLKNTANISVDTDDANAEDSSVKVVSTEDINLDPIEAFKGIKKDDVVFIVNNKPFNTAKEEWFLLNLNNKTNKVIYTMESFLQYINSQFK